MEIYLDNAATTKVFPEVCEVCGKVMLEDYGNPSSLHTKGFTAEQYIRNTAKRIAKSLKIDEKELIFTSGGTEANNLAIIGGAQARKRRGNHVITTVIEHASVYNPFIFLEENGFRVTYLSVDSNGCICLDELRAALCTETILVSIMMVNNEIGTIEPIEAAAKIIHGYNSEILFHVDAIQGYGKLPVYPKRTGIDLLSVSGHKLHGPKGSGFLYVRDKVRILPSILGGGQQNNMRSGTENVPAIAGLGEAVRLYFDGVEEKREHLYSLKEQFIRRMEAMEGTHVNAVFATEEIPLEKRVRMTAPHIVSVSFDGIRSEVLLHKLNEYHIFVSAGSACSSNHPAISGTLQAIGVEPRLLDSTIRFSFSITTTSDEIDETCNVLQKILPELRKYTIK